MRGTVAVSVLLMALFLVATPVWADDGGAPPPQPVVDQPQPVVENQVPADFQTGAFSMDGRRLGDTAQEANAVLMAEQAAERAKNPPNPFAGTPDEQHNYYDPQTKQWSGLFMVNGRAVTPQEYEADAHAKREAFLEGGRRAIRDEKAEHGRKNQHDQELEQGALDATAAQHERTEKGMAEEGQKLHEEMTRLVPSRTLRSFEANSSQDK